MKREIGVFESLFQQKNNDSFRPAAKRTTDEFQKQLQFHQIPWLTVLEGTRKVYVGPTPRSKLDMHWLRLPAQGVTEIINMNPETDKMVDYGSATYNKAEAYKHYLFTDPDCQAMHMARVPLCTETTFDMLSEAEKAAWVEKVADGIVASDTPTKVYYFHGERGKKEEELVAFIVWTSINNKTAVTSKNLDKFLDDDCKAPNFAATPGYRAILKSILDSKKSSITRFFKSKAKK